MPEASVTDIHLCARCPRLLAYRRVGEKSAWKVGYKGSGHFPGSFFHDKIAKPFYRELAGPKRSPLKNEVASLIADQPDNIAESFHLALKNHVLDPALAKHASRLGTDQIMALAGGVAAWARHLAAFSKDWIGSADGGKLDLSEVFCDPERKMKQSFALPGGGSLTVSGAFDALMVDRRAGRAMVLEFKGFKPSREDEDFLQAALYGLLIEKETGIVPSCAVLYLEEGEPEAFYSADTVRSSRRNLESLMETVCQVIAKLRDKGRTRLPFSLDRALCAVCPFDSHCDIDWGARREPESIGPDPELDDAEKAMKRLLSTLEILKLPARSDGYIAGPRLTRLKIKPDLKKGVTVRKVMSRAEDLQIAMELKAPPLIRAQAGHISIDIPRKTNQPLTLLEVWEKEKGSGKQRSRAAFPIGMAIDGSVKWADLTSPTMTSILVAGTAGSGKSVFLRAALLGMALNSGPDQIRFTLIDPKRVTFTDLSAVPHLDGPVVMDLEPALQALERLVEDMEQRYEVFSETGAIDIAEYNSLHDPMAHHVTIIDEYADLMIEKEFKKQAELFIQRLCQKGRAAGFHIILSTQRPDSKVVTPLIKANLQLKVALKVTTATNSQIVLDEPGAERLMGNGDMLVGGAVPLMRLQGPFSTKTEREMVEQLY